MINNMLPKLKPLGLSGVLVEWPLVDSTVLIVFVSVVEVGCFPGQAYLEWKIVSWKTKDKLHSFYQEVI